MRGHWLTHVVFAYLVLAFVWWAILLFRKNDEAFHAQVALARSEFLQNHNSPAAFTADETFTSLVQKRDRQRMMIIGEALVFILALMIGLLLIHRGYSRELEATRQKRNFLLAITHELKSPLASIKLILQSLGRNVFSRDDQAAILATGIAEADRLNSLVNNILLAAKLDKSYHPFIEEIDLVELSKQVIGNLRIRYPKASLTLSAPASIIGSYDKDGLTSVIYNILDNGLKYSSAPAVVILEINADENNLELTFTDHGKGIPAEHRDKIFSQFYRIGDEMSRETKGTGLGLYLVKKIIDIHRGQISIVDHEPHGSIFHVTLPRS